MSRKHFRIVGRVQGVGFRAWCHRLANGLGLRGTVRNREDGTVEAEVEGSPEAIADFEAALAGGPRFASVAAVETLPVTSDPLPPDFRIVG
jgi:acylphosphatase